MVFTRPLISKSSGPCINHLVTVPREEYIIRIIVNFMFQFRIINSLVRSIYLSHFSLSFNFILWSDGTAKITILQVLFLLLIIIRSGRLDEI